MTEPIDEDIPAYGELVRKWTDPLAIPDETARVVVQATWRGLTQKCEKAVLSDAASHHRVDKAVWDAHIEVRRLLVQQAYPGTHSTDSLTQAGIRNEIEAFGAIRNHCLQTGDRFELIPPDRREYRWRAYFKKTSEELRGRLGSNPSVGIGSVEYVAIENLLRATEGREPIDG
jgi:hypothetical protein